MYKILEAYKEGLVTYFSDDYPMLISFYIDCRSNIRVTYRKQLMIVLDKNELFSEPLPVIIFKIEKLIKMYKES